MLRACGADESFLRTHGGDGRTQRVAEFLLLDRLFPRSALHALTTAEECLRGAGAVDRAGRHGRPGAAPDRPGRTRLEYADTATPARATCPRSCGRCSGRARRPARR